MAAMPCGWKRFKIIQGKSFGLPRYLYQNWKAFWKKESENEAAYSDADSAETEDMQEGNVPGTEYLEEVPDV